MSTSTTTNLGLILDNADEPVKTHHRHANENLATLDVTIKSLQDAMENAKALLGQLGIDADDHYAVDAETARTTLGVPSVSDVADIVRQNVPLMSPTTRGVAKLDEHGGLVLRDESLGIGSLVQESDGAVRGSITGLTAEGHAEQFSTTGKNLWETKNIQASGLYVTKNADGTITINGTAIESAWLTVRFANALAAGTYTLSGNNESSVPCSLFALYNGSAIKSIYLSNVNAHATFNAPNGITQVSIVVSNGTTFSDVVLRPQLELGSTATEYEPYTGGAPSPSPDYPQEIRVARGRNLLDVSTMIAGKTIVSDGTLSDTSFCSVSDYIKVGPHVALTYFSKGSEGYNRRIVAFDKNKSLIATIVETRNSPAGDVTITGTTPAGTAFVRVPSATSQKTNAQLEVGSTPTPYVPYGHVGVDYSYTPHGDWEQGSVDTILGNTYEQNKLNVTTRVRIKTLFPVVFGTTLITTCASGYQFSIHQYKDGKLVGYTGWINGVSYIVANSDEVALIVRKTSNENIDISEIGNANLIVRGIIPTTPIPLPDRGWVGSLPDGTADVLTLDGAGKVEWELRDAETTTAATDGITGTVGVDVLSTTGQIADGATVLYKLATPVTEDCGYIDLPEIPSDATVTIPELDAIGIKYFVDDAVTQYGREIYARVRSEYADRITALEQAVAELATS